VNPGATGVDFRNGPEERRTMDMTGIHHLTAVSADIRGNYRFYTQTLGMRLARP
jgi:hypothetical protein